MNIAQSFGPLALGLVLLGVPGCKACADPGSSAADAGSAGSGIDSSVGSGDGSASAGGGGGGGGGGAGGGGDRARRSELKLTALIGSDAPVPWTRADLSKVKLLSVPADDQPRDGWSLRDVAETLVGKNAVVIELESEDGTKLVLDPTLWKDSSKLPILQQNRRGILKFQWMSPSFAPAGGQELRGVTSLRIQR